MYLCTYCIDIVQLLLLFGFCPSIGVDYISQITDLSYSLESSPTLSSSHTLLSNFPALHTLHIKAIFWLKASFTFLMRRRLALYALYWIYANSFWAHSTWPFPTISQSLFLCIHLSSLWSFQQLLSYPWLPCTPSTFRSFPSVLHSLQLISTKSSVKQLLNVKRDIIKYKY